MGGRGGVGSAVAQGCSLCGLFQPRRTYLRKGHFMEETEAHPPSDLPHRHSGGATHLPYSLGSWEDIEGPPWLGASVHCSELGLTRPWVIPGSQVAAPPTPCPTMEFCLSEASSSCCSGGF